MSDIDTTQRQIQEQKTKVTGGAAGHWIGEVLKYGFLFFVVIVSIMVFLWLFGGDDGRNTDLGIWFVLACAGLWWLYHGGRWMKNKADQAELDTHFHDVSPMLSIGDRTTEGYIPYYVPQFPDVVESVTDQHTEDTLPVSQHAAPILTLSQQREKQILEYYDSGKTMNEIVKVMAHSSIFDPPSLHDVRVALGKTGKEPKTE